MASKLLKRLNNFFTGYFSMIRRGQCPMCIYGEKALKSADQNKLLVVYKIMFDILFLSLLFFALALIAEGILPGIISSHVGLAKITILVLLLLIVVRILEANLENKALSLKKRNKKTALTLVFLAMLLIVNSQLRLGFALNLFISAVAFFIGYFIYKVLTEE